MCADDADGSGTAPAAEERPLQGVQGWLITEDKAGLAVQVIGVAEALGLSWERKTIAPKGVAKLAVALGRLPFSERIGTPGQPFAPPWPALAIGAGQASIPYLKALRRAAGGETFTVAVQAAPSGSADLIAAPLHDRCTGPNVVSTLTAPHCFGPARLAALSRTVPPAIAALPRPRVAVLLGGGNGIYRFVQTDLVRLAAALASLGRLGASLLVTPSRRTGDALLAAARTAVRDLPHLVWDGTGENPYPAFLAHADAYIVTADSVNMTGEACATGRPVFVFTPSGGSAKFARFHAALEAKGCTRPCPAHFDALPSWTYTPLDSARIIAREIERRWLARPRRP